MDVTVARQCPMAGRIIRIALGINVCVCVCVRTRSAAQSCFCFAHGSNLKRFVHLQDYGKESQAKDVIEEYFKSKK